MQYIGRYASAGTYPLNVKRDRIRGLKSGEHGDDRSKRILIHSSEPIGNRCTSCVIAATYVSSMLSTVLEAIAGGFCYRSRTALQWDETETRITVI